MTTLRSLPPQSPASSLGTATRVGLVSGDLIWALELLALSAALLSCYVLVVLWILPG